MPKTSFADVSLDVTPREKRYRLAADNDTPFRILVLGDFSGRANRGVFEPDCLSQQRPLLIDRDNFDGVFARLAPALQLSFPTGLKVDVAFTELDDFLPDRLYERCKVFETLREARLQPPPARSSSQAAGARTPAPPPMSNVIGGDLLSSMLEENDVSPSVRSTDPLFDYVRRITEPYLVEREDPARADWVAHIDREIGNAMRDLLHHPDFQAVEAAWRALYFLIRETETSPLLKIHVMDVSKPELAANMIATDDLGRTALYDVVVRQTVGTPGAQPWAITVGNFTFGPNAEDLELLGRVAMIAAQANTPFLTAAPLDGVTNDEAWGIIRDLPESGHLAIALPRFLLRLPYGPHTDACERFDFDEMPGGPRHEHYLWGNPAFALATLMAANFSERGWELTPAGYELSGRPLHSYKEDGEHKLKSPAELWFTMDQVDGLLERGFIPLIAFKDSDRIRLGRLQSFRRPLTALQGRWH
ncbi:MAG: type VI secretion system contractile sheath large subunit [Bryobacteraceae bacterium]|nr:type VI secretion system contractile sheath large subunit [Bryobacteraceae bacterium]